MSTNISPKNMRFIGIGIGVLLAVVIGGIGFTVFQGNFAGAAGAAPQNVTVTDITGNSAAVSWMTDQAAQGVVEYGTSPTALNFFAPESEKTMDHSVDLTLLSPGSTYYFQIRIADNVFDNGGVPWSFTTRTAGDSDADGGVLSPTPATRTPSIQPTTAPTEAAVAPTSTVTLVCEETDCDAMIPKFGKGCSTQDYVRCIKQRDAAE